MEQRKNAESYSEEDVTVEVGRDATTGEFEETYKSEGDPKGAVTHHWVRRIARGAFGRFVKRRD